MPGRSGVTSSSSSVRPGALAFGLTGLDREAKVLPPQAFDGGEKVLVRMGGDLGLDESGKVSAEAHHAALHPVPAMFGDEGRDPGPRSRGGPGRGG
jgi:hypothetical protein